MDHFCECGAQKAVFLRKCCQFSSPIYSGVSNRSGGRNKRGGWQISVKTINGEGAIYGEIGKNLKYDKRQVGENGEAGENTAFIEIKSSNDFVKISTKRT